VTAKKTTEKDDKNVNSATDTEKAPGDLQTTDQKAQAEADLPTKAEKQDEQPVDKVAGDDKDVQKEVRAFDKGDKVEGATGTVVEANRSGEKFDVPYTTLTADNALVRTSDSDDPAKNWTAQHASGEREDEDGKTLDPVALVPVEGAPGQTFRVSELPERDVAEKAGVDYEQFVAGLPVRPDVKDEGRRRGIPA
jgi:hypothetical protein